MESMPKVTFIRHGESVANIGGYTESFESIPLTPRGQQQAENVAGHWRSVPDRILVSPFTRTRQTAAPTIARFPQVPVEIWPVEEFSFVAPTVWHGTEHTHRQPAMEQWWQRLDPHHRDGDGAETFTEFMQRVANVIERLRALPPGRVLVFSHGHFLQALRMQIMQPEEPNHIRISRFLDFDEEHPLRNCAMFTMDLRAAQPANGILHVEYA